MTLAELLKRYDVSYVTIAGAPIFDKALAALIDTACDTARADEREACAVIAEYRWMNAASTIAKAIRTRGDKP